MSGRYGPNSAQVERFLERLADLPDDKWRRLVSRLSDRAEDRNGLNKALLILHSQHGSDRGDIEVPESDSPGFDAAVRNAAMAIHYRDLLPPQDFERLYAAFADIIPLATLEPDDDFIGRTQPDNETSTSTSTSTSMFIVAVGLLELLVRSVWRRFRK
jgi:hypothetical protein